MVCVRWAYLLIPRCILVAVSIAVGEIAHVGYGALLGVDDVGCVDVKAEEV